MHINNYKALANYVKIMPNFKIVWFMSLIYLIDKSENENKNIKLTNDGGKKQPQTIILYAFMKKSTEGGQKYRKAFNFMRLDEYLYKY